MKDAYYFPHFCNARNDNKIRRLRKQLGPEGYALFFMTLEVLREQEDYKYPLEDVDLLAEDFGTSEEKMKHVIAGSGLFTIDEGNFFSFNLVRFMEPFNNKRNERRISGIKGNLIKYGYCKKEDLNGLSDEDIIALYEQHLAISRIAIAEGSLSDRKESKVKESKVKESKEKETDFSFSFGVPKEEDFIGYFKDKGYAEEPAKQAYQWCKENNWTRKNGASILPDWHHFAEKWFEPKWKVQSAQDLKEYYKNFYRNIH